jgi:hypothetical protein
MSGMAGSQRVNVDSRENGQNGRNGQLQGPYRSGPESDVSGSPAGYRVTDGAPGHIDAPGRER